MDGFEKRRLARQILKILVERELTHGDVEEVLNHVKEELRSSSIWIQKSSIYD